MTKARFFETPAEWRAWLKQNHAESEELWVGLHKRQSGKPSITWPEAVDEALCFGWIDGVRKSIDETSYKIRFTPRKSRSIWSAVNAKRAQELSRLGLMHAAGLAAFQAREGKRTAIYSYEQRTNTKLPKVYEEQFRANEAAWGFFQSQPPGYRRTSSWWVISAKKEETRSRRLAKLIEYSKSQQPIPHLARPGKSR
jgi:uncharacterized protein YdeI (YjbR/CyaY-like superfamily)